MSLKEGNCLLEGNIRNITQKGIFLDSQFSGWYTIPDYKKKGL